MPRTDFYVYVLFRENGLPFYIGKGSGRRWLIHESDARAGKEGRRSAVIRRILAAGRDVPKLKLHEGLTESVAHDYEIALIAAIGRTPRGPLLNFTDGGDGASNPSEERRAAISAFHRGRKHSADHIAKVAAANRGLKRSPETIAKQRGRKVSPETRAKLAAAVSGFKHTPEARAKIAAAGLGRSRSPESIEKTAAAHRGKPPPPNAVANSVAARLGKPLSPEHRAKLAAVRRGRKFSPEWRAKISAALLSKRAIIDYTTLFSDSTM